MPDSDDASKFDFYGSTLVVVAASREEVFDMLSRDIYATSGVWDMENVQIWPVSLPASSAPFLFSFNAPVF